MTQWQVFCAVALRKLPEVVPRLNPIELKVREVFSAYELAMSKYSQHELQHLQDMKDKESEETSVIIRETAQDREERWANERKGFSLGEFDERLTYTRYLFIKQNFGSDPCEKWLLPQEQYDEKIDQDLMDTARRALSSKLKISNGFTIVSKIPSSVYSYKYPKRVCDSVGYGGAKVFFLKAHLDRPSKSVLSRLGGSISDISGNENLKWLTRHEAMEQISPLDYIKSFSHGLLHEDKTDYVKVLKQARQYSQMS